MKICPNCNANNFDISEKCERCGYPLNVSPFETVVWEPRQTSPDTPKPEYSIKPGGASTLQTVARVFMIIACISIGISMLPILVMWVLLLDSGEPTIAMIYLFAMIPLLAGLVISVCMTRSYSNKTSDGTDVGVGFKIITLIFISLVAGILMLCDKER